MSTTSDKIREIMTGKKPKEDEGLQALRLLAYGEASGRLAEQREAEEREAQERRLASYGVATGRNPTGVLPQDRETVEGYVSWYDRLGALGRDAEAAQGKGWQAPEDYASTWGGVKQSAGELAQEAGKYKTWWAGKAGAEGMSPEDLYNAITGIESGQRWLGNLEENIDRQGEYYGQFASEKEMREEEFKQSPEYLSDATGKRLKNQLDAASEALSVSGGKAGPDKAYGEALARYNEWEKARYEHDAQQALSGLSADERAWLDASNGYDGLHSPFSSPAMRLAAGGMSSFLDEAYRAAYGLKQEAPEYDASAAEAGLRSRYSGRELQQLREYAASQRNAEQAAYNEEFWQRNATEIPGLYELAKEAYRLYPGTSGLPEEQIDAAAKQAAGVISGTLTSAYSVGMTPFKVLGLGESIKGALPYELGGYADPNKPTDVNSPFFEANRSQQAIRQTVGENIGSPLGQFLYNAAMSTADSALNMALGGAIGGASGLTGEALKNHVANTVSWLMGSEVATDTVMEEIRNGRSGAEALGIGIVRGLFEHISEKYSIENILKTPGRWYQRLRKSFVSEGAEEVASNWMNRVFDVLVLHQSDVLDKYRELMAGGMDEAQALAVALIETDGEAFLAGGLSGLVMSGVADVSGVGPAVRTGRQLSTGQTVTELEVDGNTVTVPPVDEATAGLIESGLESPEGTESRELAETLLEKAKAGKTISTEETGRLAQANEAEIRAEASSESRVQSSEETEAAQGEREVAQDEGILRSAQNDNPAQERVAAPMNTAEERANARFDEAREIFVKQAKTGEEAGQVLASLYADTAAEHQSALSFAVGAAPYYYAGHAGKAFEDVRVGQSADITPEQARVAWNEGRIAAVREQAAAERAEREAERKAVEQEQLSREAERNRRLGASEAGFHEDDFTRANVAADDAKRIDETARLLGTPVYVVGNNEINAGRANGELVEGRAVLLEQSLFEGENAGTSVGLRIAGHEWGHRLKRLAPAEYGRVVNALRPMLTKEIENKRHLYNEVNKLGYSDEALTEEAVNDRLGDMLSDGRILDEFIRDHRQDKGLLQRLWEGVKALVRKLTGAEKRAAQNAEAKLRAALDAAATAAGRESSETENTAREELRSVSGVKYDAPVKPYDGGESVVITTTDGKEFSMKSAEEDFFGFDWNTFRNGRMYKDMRKIGMTESDIKALFDGIQDLVEYMVPHRDILDMNEDTKKGDRPYKPYKPNSDPLYKVSLDFSTLCRKRLMTQFIIENLQLRENRALSAEEQLTVRNMLKEYREQDKALQVACAMCYVEAARLKSPKFINAFLADPAPVVLDYLAKKSKAFSADIRRRQADFKEAHGYSRDTPKSKMSPADVKELNRLTPQWRQEYKPSAAEQRAIDLAKSLPRATFLTAANLSELASGNADQQTIYNAYTNYIREMTHSKGLETGVAYYYGDSRAVSRKRIEGFNDENGLRFDSWSDFQFEHLLDMMVAVIDLSTRSTSTGYGAKMHGYTKFTEMVRIFGKTGMMFNLSGVSEGTGFNEDGSLRFSETESVDFEEAKRARDLFPETAGLQCIGINDEHILALLASDLIDYIIPYHRSGMNATLRRMAGIDGWTDYEGTQEAKIDGSVVFDPAVHDKANWHREPVFSEFFVGYGTGMSGIEAMRASAENYKRMCAERGMTPKFEKFADNENYWKLLIDRKMINQKTGALIEQKPVRPLFDFSGIKKEIDRYVENYDPKVQDRAIKYVLDNWKAEPKDAASLLGNEMLAAAPEGVAASDGELSLKEASELYNTDYDFTQPMTIDEGGNLVPAGGEQRYHLREPDAATMEELTRENERLRKRVDYWKGQTKQTRGLHLRLGDLNRLTGQLVKDYAAVLDENESAELREAVARLAKLMRENPKGLQYNEMLYHAEDVARVLVQNASELVNDDEYQDYKDFKKWLKTQKITISRQDAGFIPDFTAWKKAHSAIRVGYDNGGLPIDTAYSELAGQFPGFFPESITNPTDQLERIAEVLDSMGPVYDNPYSADMAAAVEYASFDVLERIMDEDTVRPTPPTAADRQVAKYEAKLEAKDAQIKDLQQRNAWNVAQRVAQERAKRDRMIASIKQHQAEVKQNERNRRQESQDRDRLLRVARRLQRLKTTEANREMINALIGDLDTVSKGLTTKSVENLVALRDWYAGKVTPDSPDYDPDFIADKATLKKLERLSKRQIADLTITEVRELTEALLNIENQIRTARQLIDREDRRDVYYQALDIAQHMEDSKGWKKGVISGMLSPERFARRVTGYAEGDPLQRAMAGLSAGQRTMWDYQRRALQDVGRWAGNREFMRRWSGKDAQRIRIDGDDGLGHPVTATITPGMLASLYLHSMNDDNMKHVARGGVTIPNAEAYRKGDYENAYRNATTMRLQRSQIQRLAQEHLSAEDRAFIRAIMRYFNETSKAALGETAEKLLGYSPFNVDRYFPISVDQNFLHTDFDSMGDDGSVKETLADPGYAQERKQDSKPIYLRDANDVLADAIRKHSQYVGLAIPVRNVNKLIKTEFGTYTEEGERVSHTGSLKKTLNDTFGKAAMDYLNQLMKDVQGNRTRDNSRLGELLSALRSNYAGAVLTLNAGVAIKQAASYPTAAAVLKYRHLARALKYMAPGVKVDTDLIQRYTPLLWYRSLGYSSQEQGELQNRGKPIPKKLNWIQAMDVKTTAALWKAAEYQIAEERKDLQRGTDGFYRAVAELYNRVIEETQPNYAVMQRPEILRTTNELTKTLNMFKTQPFQNFNILYDAVGDWQAQRRAYSAAANDEARAEVKKRMDAARGRLGRALSSQLISSLAFALMQYAWDAFRRKDDKYKDKEGNADPAAWLKGIGLNMLGNGFGMLPFGGELLEWGEELTDKLLQNAGSDPFFNQKFYGFDASVLETMTDLAESARSLILRTVRTIQTATDSEKKTDWEAMGREAYDVAVTVSQALGIPAKNVINTLDTVAERVLRRAAGPYVGEYYAMRLAEEPKSSNAQKYYNLLYKAMENDKAAYEELYKLLIDDGSGIFTQEKIRENMEKRMKDAQGVDSVKDLQQRYEGTGYLSADQQKRYDELQKPLARSPLWREATKEQRERVEDKLYQLAAETDNSSSAGTKLQAKIDAAKEAGISEGEYMLYLLALSMADEPTDKGAYGTYTNDEQEAALDMLDGLSREDKSWLWMSTHDSDKNNPYK